MRQFWRRQEGLSMLEALVAVGILAIVSTPIVSVMLMARVAQVESTGRANAQAYAREVVERAQYDAFGNFDSVAVGMTTDITTYPRYTITRIVTCDMTYTNASHGTVCVLKTVDVTVTWIGTKQHQLAHRITTKVERRI